MTKLEEIARAMYRYEHDGDSDQQPWTDKSVRFYWENQARAAVEAMREPGFALCKTGSLPNVHPGVVDAIWKIMIAAILNEKPGGGE